MEKISIIGSGSWGTTLAALLGNKGYEVILWTRREDLAGQINKSRENRQYLKGIKLPKNVIATHSMEDISKSTLVIFAVPSSFLREVAKSFSRYVGKATVMHVVKGIESSTGKLMSEVLREELGDKTPLAVLSGPNHAEEVAANLPTATVIACEDMGAAKRIAEMFDTKYFKAYPHHDVKGTEICGAVKNIIAIAMGVCDGLKFGDNAQASILTLGLSEMSVIARKLGAKKETCYGLAGVGDLVATCYSPYSRNRSVGIELAKGKTMEQIKEDMHGMIAEGVKNTESIYNLSKERNFQTPLITHAYKVLYQKMDLRKAIEELLSSV